MGDQIFIARHGATEWSKSGQHTSRTDLPLLEEGREQAAGMVQKLAGESFELVLCSPLLRARQTCELAGFSDRAEVCDDLMEWDYGEYEGLTTAQIRESNPSWNMWQDGCPGGETPDQVGARAEAVLARFAALDGDGLAFAHGHILRVVTARWLEMDVAAGSRFKLEAGTISLLAHERETAVLERWSV
jgi:broad specificity phosphatase PhoE